MTQRQRRSRGHRPCRPSHRPVRYRDQDACDPAFARIVQQGSNEQDKAIAWGRYANRVWPLKKS